MEQWWPEQWFQSLTAVPTHCKVFLEGGFDDKRDLKEDNERVLQMFTGSWSYVWGAAWRKHKGACVTTLATGWQSWHHSQQHGAWSWYHKCYLRQWSNSAKIIISKKKDLIYIKYGSPLSHFTSTTLLPLTVCQNASPCAVNLLFLSKCYHLTLAFLGNQMQKLTADINNLFRGFPNFFTQSCLSVTIHFLTSEFIFVWGFWNLNIEKLKHQLPWEIIWFSKSSWPCHCP